jgi:hypothetical protein
MAFTKAPAQSTYSTKPVTFPTKFDNRAGSVSKDIDLLNVFFDRSPNKEEVRAFKRAGLIPYLTVPGTGVRGIYYWEDYNKLVIASGNSIYIYDSNSNALLATLSAVFSTTTGEVGFTEFLYDNNTVVVIATDGTTLGQISSTNVWTATADPDLPTPHLTQPIFLDGYLFLVKVGTADIYNSDLNNPLAYTPGNVISCEMFPDSVLRFAKLNNYLLAFGSASIEYFWDAGNASGSPLQRNDTPVKLVGYLGGFAQNANKIYFVGSSATSTPDVYILEDFKIEPCGDETVRRYLESLTTAQNTNFGNIVSFLGHDFYIMNVSNLTFSMDLKTKDWARFAYKQLNNFSVEYAISIKSNTTYTTAIFITGDTRLLKFSPTAYQDDSVNYTCRWVSTNETYDTMNRKACSKIIVRADRVPGNLMVSVSDDDYQTFSTARAIYLDADQPNATQWGQFRRRAHKFEFTENQPLRVYGIDLDLNMGQN